jgi:glyoxylase-like metal-dependent hydrolase (beta-lactamase superfamily II)
MTRVSTPPTFQPLTPEVFGLAVWDDTWHSFNNCYLIRRGEHVCLIDTLKSEQGPQLLTAIEHMNLSPDHVTAVIATHGHADHVGNAWAFPGARRYLHREDHPLLAADQAQLFFKDLPDQGSIEGLSCHRWGDHTPGSCMFHDPASGVVFAGDPLCFFGTSLPGSTLVDEAPELRRTILEHVATGDVWTDARCQPAGFLNGLRILLTLQPTYLATGHGVVLRGGLNDFLKALIDVGERSSHPFRA